MEKSSGRFGGPCRAKSCDFCPPCYPWIHKPHGGRRSGTHSRAQLQSGRSNQMVGLRATSGEARAEGEPKPDSCPGRGTAQLEQAQEPAPGGTLLDDRKEGIWLAGSMGTRRPSGQQLPTYWFGNGQHLNSIVTIRGLA